MSHRIHHQSIEIRKKACKLGGRDSRTLGWWREATVSGESSRRFRDTFGFFAKRQGSMVLWVRVVTKYYIGNQKERIKPGGRKFWSMHNYYQRWASNFVTTELNGGHAEMQKLQSTVLSQAEYIREHFPKTKEVGGILRHICAFLWQNNCRWSISRRSAFFFWTYHILWWNYTPEKRACCFLFKIRGSGFISQHDGGPNVRRMELWLDVHTAKSCQV